MVEGSWHPCCKDDVPDRRGSGRDPDATQNPELRKNFRGKPEYVINFMRFIAQNLREYMAKLGVHTIDELVGRTDLLKVKEVPTSDRAATLDLSRSLAKPL